MTGSASFGGAGTIELFNMVASGSGTTTLDRDLTVKNGLTNNSGHTINLGSRTLTLKNDSGSFTNNGSITGTTDSTFEYAPSGTSGTTIAATRYPGNVKVNKTGNTFTASAGSLFIGNKLNVAAGTLDLNTNSPTVEMEHGVTIDGALSAPGASSFLVEGDWTNNGTFTHNNGTVSFQPVHGPMSIGGSVDTTFYNLSAQAGTLQFNPSRTPTVTHNLTLAGQSGNPLYLKSTSPGSQWTLNLTGSGTASYVYVQDGACSPGSNTINLGETGDTLGNTGACWVRLSRGGDTGVSGGGSPSGGGGQYSGGEDSGEGGGTPTGGGTPGGDNTPAP